MRNRCFSEIVLSCCLWAIASVYVFYFLIIPQDWSLMDHYAFAVMWKHPGFNPLQGGAEFLKSLMSVGRFRPIDAYERALDYWVVPVTPRAFHAVQFGLAGVALGALFMMLRRAGLSLAQALLALVAVAGGLTMKDWLFYTSAAEPLATAFILLSFACYTRGKKIAGIAFYVAAFLTKESFFIFIAAFYALEAWELRRPPRRLEWLPLLIGSAAAAAFVLYVLTLPRIYTGGESLSHLSLKRLVVAFVCPPFKSLGPALVLAAYSRIRARSLRLSDGEIRTLILGLTLVTTYTLMLAAWGPFDSWFYLHIPIPFGWAMILASLWRPETCENDRVHQGLLAATFAFFVLIDLNGSRNLTTMHSEVQIVARIACEESERIPGLQIFNNCNEGSVQLRQSLILGNECKNPPEFHYLNRAKAFPADTKPPYVFILAKKCDPFDLSSVPASTVLPLRQWTVIKRF